MNRKLFAIPFAAVAVSAMLSLTAAPTFAAGPTVTMTELNQRVATLPQLAGLKNGDTVIISDDGSVTGANFSGEYIYHPAGSIVNMDAMYARWKDGLVTITASGEDASQMLATFIQQRDQLVIRDDITNDVGINVPVSQQQVTEALVTEPTDSSILRIADNAWLFRDNGNGTYTALVDVFEFKSGSTPTAATLSDDTTPLGTGNITQPVPVLFQ